MNLEIKSVHFNLDNEQKEYVQKKIERIRNTENMIVDFLVTITKDASKYIAETNINFKWGVHAHISESDFEVLAAVDKMFDALRLKITKEKEKAEEKNRKL